MSAHRLSPFASRLSHRKSPTHDRRYCCTMDCRVGCGACCIALSISSPIPGMPDGKPSGVRCVQLTDDNRCMLWGKPERPEVCNRLTPMVEMCGETTDDALRYLYWLESQTKP